MPAGSLLDAAKDLQAEMKAAGLKRTYLSRKDVQPPGYLIALNEIRYVLAGGIFDLSFVVYAVGSDTGEDEERALGKLDELHAAFILAGFQPESPTTVVALNLPTAAKPVPALRMNITSNT